MKYFFQFNTPPNSRWGIFDFGVFVSPRQSPGGVNIKNVTTSISTNKKTFVGLVKSKDF